MIDANIPLASVAPGNIYAPFQAVGNLQTQQANLKSIGMQQQSDQLKLDSENQNATDQAHTRAAYAAAADPNTGQVNRPVLLSTLNKLDPYLAARTSSALNAQDQAAQDAQIKTQQSQAVLQKEQLANAEAHVQLKDKLLQGAVDQPTWNNARAIAIQQGINPAELPQQYDPQFVAQAHAQTLSQLQVIQNQQKAMEDQQTAQNNQAQRQQAAINQAETARHNKAEEGVSYANIALKKQEMAVAKGDPNAAGALLANHDATLSELKARGSTPEYIVQALNAAKRINPNYNPQQDEAQFQVAKSPTNVAFFGSAKSLTDPGGTLEQLSQVGSTIPQSQFPALNSVADWEKAAAGSGPVAKYAAQALGVADDYAKVMGGGQGSDTSRAQALKIIAANLSPEGRAAAIDGIRGTVNSQTKSRIGSNPVLGRMYGDVGGGGQSTQGGGMVTVQIPGMAPGQIPAAAVAKFKADHPDAQVSQ